MMTLRPLPLAFHGTIGEGADVVLLSAWASKQAHPFHHLLALTQPATINPQRFARHTPHIIPLIRPGLPSYLLCIDTHHNAAIAVIESFTVDRCTVSAFYPEPVHISPKLAHSPVQQAALGSRIDTLFAQRREGARWCFSHDERTPLYSRPSWHPLRLLHHHPSLGINIRTVMAALGARLWHDPNFCTTINPSLAARFGLDVRATISIPERTPHAGVVSATTTVSVHLRAPTFPPSQPSRSSYDHTHPLVAQAIARIQALPGLHGHAYADGLVSKGSFALVERGVDIAPLTHSHYNARLPLHQRHPTPSMVRAVTLLCPVVTEPNTAHKQVQAYARWDAVLHSAHDHHTHPG